jgi:hypothetical protein
VHQQTNYENGCSKYKRKNLTNLTETVKLSEFLINEGISAASFCCPVAALVPDMSCYFYVMKNHKIANNSTTTEAREKISTYLKSLEFLKIFDVHLTKFEILLNEN